MIILTLWLLTQAGSSLGTPPRCCLDHRSHTSLLHFFQSFAFYFYFQGEFFLLVIPSQLPVAYSCVYVKYIYISFKETITSLCVSSSHKVHGFVYHSNILIAHWEKDILKMISSFKANTFQNLVNDNLQSFGFVGTGNMLWNVCFVTLFLFIQWWWVGGGVREGGWKKALHVAQFNLCYMVFNIILIKLVILGRIFFTC